MRSSAALTLKMAAHFPAAAGSILLTILCSFDPACSAFAQGSDHVGQLVVRVRDRHSENSLDHARVELVRFPQEVISERFTGGDGGVQFSGIGIGSYIVRASRQGYQSGEARVDFRRGDSTLQSVDIPLLPVDQDRIGAPGGTISADDLKIPESARKEFERGKRLLNEKKDQLESIAAFRRAIELYPDYSDAYFLLGTAQMQLNDAKAAEASLRKAIALDAHRTGPYYPLAMLLFGQRRFDDEEELLCRPRNRTPRTGAGPSNWPAATRRRATGTARFDTGWRPPEALMCPLRFTCC